MWIISCCIILQGLQCVYSLSSDENLHSQLNHFSTNRNNYVNPKNKAKAHEHIMNTFKEFGLDTWTEEFPSNHASYPGINVIGRVNGRYTGTSKDKILLIGSHYDTVQGSDGVDDNGSGMTALLQILAKYKSSNNAKCNQSHTLLFVAFDLEEKQGCDQVNQSSCSCPHNRGICGSSYFVRNLTSYLNGTGMTLQGAFVLETLLNYNTTEHSQNLPPLVSAVLPAEYQQIQDNKFKGDFLAVIGRKSDDAELMKQLVSNFDQGRFKAIQIPLPITGRPIDSQYYPMLKHFLRSDHTNFWNSANSWPALFITDTADFRGFMKTCYHQKCDNLDHVTPDMITFMGKTADALVKAAHTMTGRVCSKQDYCGSNIPITSNNVSIFSPSHPSKYPNDVICSWIRKSEYPQTLEFTDFDLEDSVNCTNDYVEVIAGGKSKGRYCGSTKPALISTSEKSLTLRFVSDAFINKKGFQVIWSTKTPTTGKAAQFYASPKFLLVFLLSAMIFSS